MSRHGAQLDAAVRFAVQRGHDDSLDSAIVCSMVSRLPCQILDLFFAPCVRVSMPRHIAKKHHCGTAQLAIGFVSLAAK